jgi:hypothetical protein
VNLNDRGARCPERCLFLAGFRLKRFSKIWLAKFVEGG